MRKYNEPVITQFHNGMELVTIANELVASSQTGFATGTRHDPPGAIGMAHSFEHLGCRGAAPEAIAYIISRNLRAKMARPVRMARPVPVSQRSMDRCCNRFFGGSDGAGINVYTMTSTMGFGHQDLFKPRYLKRVFSTLAGVVRDAMYDMQDLRNRDEAVLSPHAWKVERPAVGNETADNDEQAATPAYRAALHELYRLNPAREYGDSDPAHLAKLRLGSIKLWGQHNIVTPRMKVIIIGPSRNAAVRMLREVGLNRLKEHQPAPWYYDRSDDVPVLDGIRAVEVSKAAGLKHHMHVLWPTETYESKDALALEVLVPLLKHRIEGEQRESNELDPGGVYHPHVEWDASSSHGTFEFWYSTRGDLAHCEDLLKRAMDVIERLKDDESDQLAEDVDDFRNYLADAYIEQYLYMPGIIADRILHALANGDTKLEKFKDYPAAVRRVTPAQVRRVARKYLHTDRYVRALTRPVHF